MRRTLTDFKSLAVEIEQRLAEVQVVAELVKALVKENASTVQSQEAYLKRYEELTKRYVTKNTKGSDKTNFRSAQSL